MLFFEEVLGCYPAASLFFYRGPCTICTRMQKPSDDTSYVQRIVLETLDFEILQFEAPEGL